MSTEARHASIPPRPTTPPRPAEPPRTGAETTHREEPDRTPAATDDRTRPEARVPAMPTERPTSGPAAPTTAAPPMPTARPTTAVPPKPTARPATGSARTAGDDGGERQGSRVPPTRETTDAPRRGGPAEPARATSSAAPPRFPRLRVPPPGDPAPLTPPPPRASARFPDAPPAAATPPRREGAPPETTSETTFRLRPYAPEATPARDPDRSSAALGRPMPSGRPPRPTAASTDTHTTRAGDPASPLSRPPATPPASPEPFGRTAEPDPSLSWNAPLAPGEPSGSGRPVVSFGQPEGYDEQARPRLIGGRNRLRAAGVAVCLVLGLGLIGGAVTGSWLVGDSAAAGTRDTFAAAAGMWHSVPVDQLFPPTLQGQGAGPGGADRTWTRIAVAPDSGCADAFDPLLRKALAPVGCQRLLRATYTDATQSYVTTVGLLFTKADADGMTALDTRFDKEGLGRRADLMPRPYAAKDTAAAGFGAKQRASWTISVLTDAPVVVYAVSGWADGRTVDEPQPAEAAMESGATTAVAQAGLGQESQGLADRVERGLRKTVSSATEQPS
ncbi:hypothetical protein [Streptomyces sp. RG80]|uniref:hypothetical protein n=1 Tax=Streptomyces sp. RG80 TaxID=3157340 RepID=UPI00338EEBF2